MREAAARAPAAEKKTPDYRRMVELNRMEGDLNRAWRQNAASRSPDEPPDYSRMPSSRLAVLRNQAQIDLDTDTLNQINQVFKTRRAARGQQTAAAPETARGGGTCGDALYREKVQEIPQKVLFRKPPAEFCCAGFWDFRVFLQPLCLILCGNSVRLHRPRYRNVTICARVQFVTGLNIPPPVPPVIPRSTAHRTASA